MAILKFQEVATIYTDQEAPEGLKSLINIWAVDYISINTAGDDTDNTGDYYVWAYMRSGVVIPIYQGDLESCKDFYERFKSGMSKNPSAKSEPTRN